MTTRLPNRRHGTAAGYWSSPWKILQLDQMADRVRVLLQDKLLARGRVVELYLPVSDSTAGVVACTCTKNTTDQADRLCLTCFGTKYAPGYLKFLHATHFWCSAESASFTLTGTSISTTKKANIIILNDAALTGTIVTQDKAFTNRTPTALAYAVKLDAYRRTTGSTIALEYSVDAGGAYTPIVLTEVTGGYGFTSSVTLPAGAGNVRFRVTMTRLTVDDLTPAFEIVRIRRVLSERTNAQITRRRSDFTDGKLLVNRPWTQEQDGLDPSRGRIIEHLADQTWTAPLDMFDTSLTRDTPSCRVQEYFGPHPFYVYTSGVQATDRYVITQVNWNETLGAFTHQYLQDRRCQQNEPVGSVW